MQAVTHRNPIRNPAREQITAAIKAALDAAPNRSELARQIGVSRKQTYEWEAGNNTPSLEMLAALAEATGTQIVLAFGLETTKEAAPDVPERLERIEGLVWAIAAATPGVELEELSKKLDAKIAADLEASRRQAAERIADQAGGQSDVSPGSRRGSR